MSTAIVAVNGDYVGYLDLGTNPCVVLFEDEEERP